MTYVIYTDPRDNKRHRLLFKSGDLSAVAQTLREIGMRHVVIEEDA
jgi:hypothetical protein